MLKEDVTLSTWQSLLEQLPAPRQAHEAAPGCLCAAKPSSFHPDVLAAGDGYFISLVPDFKAQRLTNALVRAEVPLPRKILAHPHSTQFRRALDRVVNSIASVNLRELEQLVRLGFPVAAVVDLEGAADVAAQAAVLPAHESAALIHSSEARFPLPPLLAALQQSSAVHLGRSLRLLQSFDPLILQRWAPVTGRPLPNSLLCLPPGEMVGRHAHSTYLRWAVLHHDTPLFGITPFHTMFHNTFQPQHLFDAAALLPRASGAPGDIAMALQAPSDAAVSDSSPSGGSASAASMLGRYLAAAANPSSVPSGVSAPPSTPLPPVQLPLINALDAFGNSALCHAVQWALGKLCRAAIAASNSWRSGCSGECAPCGGHAQAGVFCSQCSSGAAITGAMWMTWRHCAEAVFRTLLSLGADSSRPQHMDVRRRRAVAWRPVPLVEMLIMQWPLPALRDLPSKYTRFTQLPVDFSGALRGRNLVAAREWQARDNRRPQGQARPPEPEATVPPDLAGGAACYEVDGDNEQLLEPEHQHLTRWLAGSPDGFGIEPSMVQYRQRHAFSATKTTFDAIKLLLDALEHHAEHRAAPFGSQSLLVGTKSYPGCVDDPQVQLNSDNISHVQPHVFFLLQRLLELGAVPSILAGRMLYFYAEVLPGELSGVLWYRRRRAVLSRRQQRAQRKAAAQQLL